MICLITKLPSIPVKQPYMTKIITSNDTLIHIESEKYPLTIRDLGARHPHISFGTEVPEDFLKYLGYDVVQKTPRISSDGLVEEGKPIYTDEGYEQVWVTREPTEEENASQLEYQKTDLLMNTTSEQDRVLSVGQPFLYEGKVHHLQLRHRDVAMITALMVISQRRVELGDDSLMLVRTYENVCVYLSPTNVLELTAGALLSITELHASKWEFQSKVSQAKSIPDLPNKLVCSAPPMITFK